MLERRATRTAPPRRVTRRSGDPSPALQVIPGNRAVEGARLSTFRPFLLLVAMLICSALLSARLMYWQVLQHGHLSAMARTEHQTLNVQPAIRGRILDSHGSPLATDVQMNLVYAVPRDVSDPAKTAHLLAPVLTMQEKPLTDLLSGDSTYVPLANHVDQASSRRIQDLALPGITLIPQIQRYYPDGTEAAQVLGFVAGDGHGYWGLEGYYDQLLAGTAGLRSVLKDTAGNDIHISSQPSSPAHNGGDLHLSIDSVVQSLADDDLTRAVRLHHADSGTIIVMSPDTGYILAMANTPAFNPNHRAAGDATRYANPAAEDLYEPGSTFKIVTMAAGLDTHVITPNTAFDDTGNFYAAPGVVLHNWNLSGFGMETMTQVLQHSANVGAAWVAQHLGTNAFYDYLRRFHIGRSTGVDLQGESPGLVPLPGQPTWTSVNLYTNAFGQGLAVTPLQMIDAVSAIANGGVLMKPQLVTQIDYDGRIIGRSPVSLGRVVSAQTAHTLTHMLVQSAIGGEASLGLVKGYNVAAKTGTANIAGPNGKYIQGATVASIVGYAPADHPRFVALVIIRRPRDTPWGSMAAAPVLHQLFQQLFMYYHIPPNPHALLH